ncbi:MAG: AI-2E family transporter [Roseococcus sp.]|nr:AI-2E family transporter [Roseococcus sp.]
MKLEGEPDTTFEKRLAASLLDMLIRAGLIVIMAALCFQVFSPFLPLMMWALILAVTLYPLQQRLAAGMGGREGLASTVLVMLGVLFIVAPTILLMSSLGTSIQDLIAQVHDNTLAIPAPPDALAQLPFIGPHLHALWSQARDDLPGLVQGMQPKIGDLARSALGFVAGIGGDVLRFLASFIVAGIIMAFGRPAKSAGEAIFRRLAGEARGGELAKLSIATIRAVALGVIGIAFIQAVIVGLCLLVAGLPWAGFLALVVLVLGIAQIPALIVTLPAIGYIWWTGSYGSGEAIAYSVLLLVAGMLDNVLKPLLLGRGVDAPMPIILLGALGGMATGGIIGIFVGATIFATGYQIFMGWVVGGLDEAVED